MEYQGLLILLTFLLSFQRTARVLRLISASPEALLFAGREVLFGDQREKTLSISGDLVKTLFFLFFESRFGGLLAPSSRCVRAPFGPPLQTRGRRTYQSEAPLSRPSFHFFSGLDRGVFRAPLPGDRPEGFFTLGGEDFNIWGTACQDLKSFIFRSLQGSLRFPVSRGHSVSSTARGRYNTSLTILVNPLFQHFFKMSKNPFKSVV